jgi:hypothetical protein
LVTTSSSAQNNLLGLVGEGNGIAAKVLKSLGVGVSKEAREEIGKSLVEVPVLMPLRFPYPPQKQAF